MPSFVQIPLTVLANNSSDKSSPNLSTLKGFPHRPGREQFTAGRPLSSRLNACNRQPFIRRSCILTGVGLSFKRSFMEFRNFIPARQRGGIRGQIIPRCLIPPLALPLPRWKVILRIGKPPCKLRAPFVYLLIQSKAFGSASSESMRDIGGNTLCGQEPCLIIQTTSAGMSYAA